MPTRKDHHLRSGKNKNIRKDKNATGLSLSLYVDKRNDEIAMKVIDNKTLKVRREIPPPELRDIKEDIDDIVDTLFNSRKSALKKGD